MQKRNNTIPFPFWLSAALLFFNCASQIQKTSANVPSQQESQNQSPVNPVGVSGPKHRIAIAEFVDKSGYGSNLFGTIDDLGSQASDILASHLIKTQEFIVLEREKLGNLKSENELQAATQLFVGVTALIFGSVTEFGTKTEAMDAGITKSKKQTAHAKVTIRLVDPKTGVAFYSEFGEANAEKEVNQTFGFGSKAGYDATLTDKALNGAVVKLVGNILNTLKARKWSAPILDIQEQQVFIGAGARTGLKVGDVLNVIKPGKTVKNPSTGAVIELPGTTAGKIKVVSQFGNSDLDEGSVCQIIQGSQFDKTYRVEMGE